LGGAVVSAMQQIETGDQVILWDNGDDEATGQILEKLKVDWPALQVFRSATNLGFAGGNNAAAKLANAGADLLLLNPDAVLKPGAVQAMRRALSVTADVAAVGAVQLSSDESTVDGLGDVYHFTGLPWRAGHGSKDVDRHLRGAGSEPASTEIFGPCGAAALYRREAFDAVGGFDEDYFCYCEDVDLAFRLRNRGWVSVRANDAVVLHIGSVSTGTNSDFSVYHGHRNLVWTFLKNMPVLLLVLLMLPHLLMIILITLRYVVQGRARTIVRARVDAVRGLGNMLGKRREIQGSRRASTVDIWRALDKSLWR
jgi:GT2 family glycosyltransferase